MLCFHSEEIPGEFGCPKISVSIEMTEWMELTFCHFNDQRNLVEAWRKDPEIINKKVGTSSFLICSKNWLKMGRRLETILHRAALRSRREMVELLVKQRAPQVQDVNGNTPLHCAALGGDPQVARLLLDGGADVEACNSEGDRPLHLAAGAGNLAVLRLLLQVGAILIQNCQFLMNRREQCWRVQDTSTTQRSTPPQRMPR